MTAAMAFFSIALTLNLTGIHLGAVRLADLRPIDVRTIPGEARSFLERRLTMASTPVIRYYDHSRFVYEVQSKSAGDAPRDAERGQQPAEAQSSLTGRIQTDPEPHPRQGARKLTSTVRQPAGSTIPPQILQTSLRFQRSAPAFRRLQKNTSEAELEKRSTLWIA